MSKNKGMSAEELLQEALVPVEEQPYNVPKNWVWVRLGNVAQINPPKSKMSDISEDDICSFIPMTCVSDKLGTITEIEQRTYAEVKKGYTQFLEGDVLFAKITPCMENGKSAIAKNLKNGFGYGSTEFFVIRTSKHIDNRYIHMIVRSVRFRAEAKGQMTGAVGQQRVPKTFLENYCIPLPPVEEQKQIADKVERLLNKINQAKQLIEEAKETFELRRAAILDKAFRGEMTSKWRDENIKPISGDNTINLSEYEGVLNNIPDTWCWSKLKDFEGEEQLVLTGPFGTTLSNKDFVESGIPVLTIGCLQDEGINLNKANYVTEDKANTLNRYRVKEGDILFSRMATVGRASRVGKSFEDCLINYHLMRVRLPRDINVDYFLLVVKGAPSTKLFLKSMNHGMTRDGINTKELLNLPIPFPPIEEQKRIVEFFSSLQEKEEQMNQKIHFVESVLSQLQVSILSTAFRGELGTNFEVEESSIEELKQLIKM